MSDVVRTTVFSVLFNEDRDHLRTIFANFLGHTSQDEHLVINLAPGRYNIAALGEVPARIHLLVGATERQKLGHTLLVGHLESFEFALNRIGAFDYFCTLASNSLFVRPFRWKAAQIALSEGQVHSFVKLRDLPQGWWWPRIRGNEAFAASIERNFGIDEVASSQIEGFFAARRDWSEVHKRLPGIIEAGRLLAEEGLIPLEEVFPATIIGKFGSRRVAHICHMFWNRLEQQGGLVEIQDIVDVQSRFPPHIFAMKWFPREKFALPTALVSDEWGTRLARLLAEGPADDEFFEPVLRRMLLEQGANALRGRETYAAATAPVDLSPYLPVRAGVLKLANIPAARQYIVLSAGLHKSEHLADSYILMENSGSLLDVTIEHLMDADTPIRITCADARKDSDQGNKGGIQGYLYLKLAHPETARASCIVRTSIFAEDGHALRRGIVFASKGRYSAVPSISDMDSIVTFESYYRLKREPDLADGWIGLPIIMDCSYAIAVEVYEGPSRPPPRKPRPN
ncbi:hypothetical protein [Roseococcus sp. YIM B11640]|uniref:hypothetical protein n=1 Tax=Roseococcus sp. YIM B11640 TaxID=3133973 RepID=UPI003C7AFB1E